MNKQERDTLIMTKLNEGMSLSDVQKILAQDYNIRMTYLELRLLADDLAVNWEKLDKPKPAPQPAEQAVTPEEDDESFDEDDDEDLDDDEDFEEEEEVAEPGAVKVTIDPAPRPGMILSGMVRFASGIRAGWMMDRRGRLNLDLPDDGPQPSQEDLQGFQEELRRVMQQKDEEMRRAANDGRTKVTINPVVPAGVKIGGNVEFASGAKGDWYIDNSGRMGFNPAEGSTNPTQEDVGLFQVVLQQELRKHGYGV
ncbi:MAG: hypothetical protein BWX73_01461 [Lentisphaerae bacterium ADurb.Bin082]|nr:MAG: hypothetical protein BWX73_01461 [Lentisphaerae bacterium ADurb.Bin082]